MARMRRAPVGGRICRRGEKTSVGGGGFEAFDFHAVEAVIVLKEEKRLRANDEAMMRCSVDRLGVTLGSTARARRQWNHT